MRRHRERQRNGVIVTPVAVNEDVIDVLIRLNWLRERDADDRAAIAKAVTAMISDASARFLRLGIFQSGPLGRVEMPRGKFQ
jgi:hypothetical protein